jgi:FMNH2-dependent dimethyl sulfone monooxygenase
MRIARSSSKERVVRDLGDQKFKLGLFSANRWGGLAYTTAPERWDASWENQVAAARAAEDAGLDFLLPLGTWLGKGGDSKTDGHSYETLTWAAGLLAATSRIKVFATLSVAYLNPVLAAKQAMTCDHIGQGRFGLNITSGFNPQEFEAFGLPLLEHDDRYARAEAWLDVVERIWSGEGPFDVSNEYFQLKGVAGGPAPVGGDRPIVVSAGASPAGRAFAVRKADYWFIMPITIEKTALEIAKFREVAPDMEAMGSGQIFCRPTRAEAIEYYDYLVHEHGDWKCADTAIHDLLPGNSQSVPENLLPLRERYCAGSGTFPFVGSPDDVADTFKQLSDAGLNGMAFGLPDYIDDFPVFRDEVIPRLERLGLRVPASVAAR